MKKVFCILMTFVCVFGLFGCGKTLDIGNSKYFVGENDFVEVCSITYAYRDLSNTSRNITIYSKISYITDDFAEVTQEEYGSADYYIDNWSPINLNTEKSNVPTMFFGNYYYYYRLSHLGDFTYFKARVTGIEYEYVSVKVINNNTVVIKASDGDVTQYMTEYYSISFFK